MLVQLANHLVCTEYFGEALSSIRCKRHDYNFQATKMLLSATDKRIVHKTPLGALSVDYTSERSNVGMEALEDVSVIPQLTP